MNTSHYSRRKILRLLLNSGLLASAPLSFGLSSKPNKNAKLPKLILFEMFGGNDNLNTLVPYKDPLYTAYRPTIGLSKSDYTPLNDELALNNAMKPLLESWEQGQLAIIQDVGSKNASLSHFKSIKIIETASDKNNGSIGWIADTISQNSTLKDKRWDLNSVWAGGHIESLIGVDMIPYSPSRGAFSKYLNKYHLEDTAENSHLLDKTINSYVTYTEQLKGKLPEFSRFADRFHSYQSEDAFIGKQCTNVLRMIEGGINAPAFKIGMSGFDLHSSLRGKHEILLLRTANNLANLRQSLIELNEWDNTIILAYSEFGRRPKENASLGTDHGSSGPMFLLGGKVNGGIKGKRADLNQLNSDGNLYFQTNYESIFSSIIDDFWKAKKNPFDKYGYTKMDNLFS